MKIQKKYWETQMKKYKRKGISVYRKRCTKEMKIQNKYGEACTMKMKIQKKYWERCTIKMKIQEKYGETCTIHQSRPPWSSWVQACHWTATHPPLWLMIHPQSSDKTSRYTYKYKYKYKYKHKYKHTHSNNPQVGELAIIFETNFFVGNVRCA